MSCGWWLFPSGLQMVDISRWPQDGCCYFLVESGLLLYFPAGLWLVAVISWRPVDGCCFFLVGFGWFLLFRDGL